MRRTAAVAKTLIPAFVLAVSARVTVGQNTMTSTVLSLGDVPAAVRQGYSTKFPGKRKTEWKRKSDGAYEAEFDLRGLGIAAKFDAAGTWLETESDITAVGVPTAVSRTIARDFKNYKIVERQRVEPRAGSPLFELHLRNGKETIRAQFDSSGRLVARSSKPRA